MGMTHFYEPRLGHGLPHDPFNAIVGPRPIGWISTRSNDGVLNLAPYSFFTAFNYSPEMGAIHADLLAGWARVTDAPFNAFVDVAGVGKSATDSLSRPLVVALDDQSTSEREVFVYKKGFRAYRKRHTFIAGETLQLDVVLEPDPGDAVSPPAPDR